MAKKKRVLFLCVGNSCRSQMAEGLLRNLAEHDFAVHSAGAEPAGVNPNAVAVMAEIGIDISWHTSKHVDVFADQEFDYVITVCDSKGNASCPVFLGRVDQQLHWPFEDPPHAQGDAGEEVLNVFRRVRDQIKTRLERFVEDPHESCS